MLHLDLPSRDQLRALIEHRSPVCVSLYLPTTPLTQDAQADRIALGNLAREALRQVEAASPPRGALGALSEQLDDLVEDDAFWRLQARSLAVFATPERALTFRLPNAIVASVSVADRFHVTPLLRAVAFPPAAHILALAAGGARLLELGPEGPLVELRVEGMPDDAADAVGKASIKDHSHGRRVGGAAGEKVRLRQYARAVDRAIRDRLQGEELPLLLVGNDPLAELYRSVSSHPRLDPAPLPGSPDTLDDEAIAALARRRLDERRDAELAALRDTYARREGEGRASADLAVAARAAAMGAVDTLLVDMDSVLPGLLDEATGEIRIEGTADARNYGLADAVARLVLAHGGRVVALRAGEMPHPASPVAVLLRHPMIQG